MIRNKRILSIILAAAIASNVMVTKAYASTNQDELYKIAYESTLKALKNKTQKDINEARKAIDNIPVNLQWAKGEFSKQVDTVQHPILVEIVNAIEKARSLGDQKSINEARKKISKELPSQWRAAYSEAVDDVQRRAMKKAVESIEKAKTTKNKEDINTATELLKLLGTVEGNDGVKAWSSTISKEFEGFVKKLEGQSEVPSTGGSGTGGTSQGGGSSSGNTSNSQVVYNVNCEAGVTKVIDNTNGASVINIMGNSNGTIILKGIIVEQVNIDAPNGDVVLNDVRVKKLNVTDIAEHSLKLINSTINDMIVKDKDNKAHIVILGDKTSIGKADIKSGASIESEVTIHQLLLSNEQAENQIKLEGNFRNSRVIVEGKGKIEIGAKIDTLQIAESVKDKIEVTLENTARVNSLDVKAENKLQLKAKDGNESTITNAIREMKCSNNDNELGAIQIKISEDLNKKKEKEAEILNAFSKYIKGSPIEDNSYKQQADSEVLDLLKKSKEDIQLPGEFLNGEWGNNELMEYAGSVRCIIKGLNQNIASMEDLERHLHASKLDMKVRLESYKFKTHRQNPQFKEAVIKVAEDVKDLDITDEILGVTQYFDIYTMFAVIGVCDGTLSDNKSNDNFVIKNVNGSNRIILKSVNKDVLDKSLAAQVRVEFLQATTTTNLMFKVVKDTDINRPLLNDINKYANKNSTEIGDEILRKDREMLAILEKYKTELPLPEEFVNGQWDQEMRQLYAKNFRFCSSIGNQKFKTISEIKPVLDSSKDQLMLEVEFRKYQFYGDCKQIKPCVIKVNSNSSNVDITDEVMKATSKIAPNIKISLQGVSEWAQEVKKDGAFAIETHNGEERVILKKVSSEILNKRLELWVQFELESGDAGYISYLQFTIQLN